MAQIEVNGENYKKCRLITEEIKRLLKNIQNDTAMFSTSNHIIEHEDYAILKNYGKILVPYLIYCITQYGTSWIILNLLRDITNEKPFEKEDVGKLGVITARWLLWYDTWEGKANDVYFGLLNNE